MTAIHWSSLTILDGDGETRVTDPEARAHALRQLHDTETMDGYFLEPLDAEQAELDASEWGPGSGDIDWSGFDPRTGRALAVARG